MGKAEDWMRQMREKDAREARRAKEREETRNAAPAYRDETRNASPKPVTPRVETRNAQPTEGETRNACVVCGEPVPKPRRGPVGRYCGAPCRLARVPRAGRIVTTRRCQRLACPPPTTPPPARNPLRHNARRYHLAAKCAGCCACWAPPGLLALRIEARNAGRELRRGAVRRGTWGGTVDRAPAGNPSPPRRGEGAPRGVYWLERVSVSGFQRWPSNRVSESGSRNIARTFRGSAGATRSGGACE